MKQTEYRPDRPGYRDPKTEIIYGRHPVHAALQAGKRRFEKLYLLERAQGKIIRDIIKEAERQAVPVSFSGQDMFAQEAGPGVLHQGVMLVCQRKGAPHWKEVLERYRHLKEAVVIFGDRIEDTRNLGALIRNAVAFGAGALILSRARTAPLEASGVKASAGAVESLDILQINNFADVLAAFREAGYWILSLAAWGDRLLWDTDLTAGPLGVVIGGEDQGVRKRVVGLSDWNVQIPLQRDAHSLNASVALGIALYEIRRQQALSRVETPK